VATQPRRAARQHEARASRVVVDERERHRCVAAAVQRERRAREAGEVAAYARAQRAVEERPGHRSRVSR
jgi:hypothetical protein